MHTFHLFAQTNAPQKDRYIFLWDVSVSLLSYNGNGPSEDEYTQQDITTTYDLANGLWMKLKNALIESIKSIKVNEQSEIIVIPFYAGPLGDPFKEKATKEGKDKIIKKIKEYTCPKDTKKYEQRTDLILALEKFEEIVKKDCLDYVNYLFFYTDGAHESIKNKPESDCTKVGDKINKFNDYATGAGRYIYRFYYDFAFSEAGEKNPNKQLYETIHNNIKRLESDSNRFWVVDELVLVKFIGLKSLSINYNMSDNSGKKIKKDEKKSINLTREFGSYKGKFIFTPQENNYYNVVCYNNDTSIIVTVTPKEGVDLPKKSTIIVNCKLEWSDNQKYYYLLDDKFEINCINIPERCVSLSLKNTVGDKSNGDERLDLGKTSYYPPFMGKSSQLNCLDFSLSTKFDDYAVKDKARFDVYFADSEGKPLTYTDFKIVVNKLDKPDKPDTLSTTNRSFCIESGQEQIDFTILPSETTDDVEYKGYLVVSDINDIDRINGKVINDKVSILPWGFEHDRNWNPRFKGIFWGVIIIVLLFFAAIILDRILWLCGPKFHSGWNIIFDNNINPNTNDNFPPNITYDCPKDIFKNLEIFEHKCNRFFAWRLHPYRIKEVVLCNKTSITWNYWKGYSICVKTDFGAYTIRRVRFLPSKDEGILAYVTIIFSDNSTKDGQLRYQGDSNTTGEIPIDHTNINIIGTHKSTTTLN